MNNNSPCEILADRVEEIIRTHKIADGFDWDLTNLYDLLEKVKKEIISFDPSATTIEVELTNESRVYRAVTQSDIDRNEVVRTELKLGEMAWFEN